MDSLLIAIAGAILAVAFFLYRKWVPAPKDEDKRGIEYIKNVFNAFFGKYIDKVWQEARDILRDKNIPWRKRLSAFLNVAMCVILLIGFALVLLGLIINLFFDRPSAADVGLKIGVLLLLYFAFLFTIDRSVDHVLGTRFDAAVLPARSDARGAA